MLIRVILFGLILFCAIFFSCQYEKYPHGKRSYLAYCGDCHMEDGSGVADLYPRLNKRSIVDRHQEIPCIIREGIYNEESLIKMPAHPKMSNVDITNIINYITYDINKDKTSLLLLRDVDRLLQQCQ